MWVDSPFLATIREPLFALHLFDCYVSSVKKYRLGTSKCHDHDILTLHQPIRLQHFERGNEKISSCIAYYLFWESQWVRRSSLFSDSAHLTHSRDMNSPGFTPSANTEAIMASQYASRGVRPVFVFFTLRSNWLWIEEIENFVCHSYIFDCHNLPDISWSLKKYWWIFKQSFHIYSVSEYRRNTKKLQESPPNFFKKHDITVSSSNHMYMNFFLSTSM